MAEELDSTLPNPHLALFQSLGKVLRQDPTAVTGQMSAWLSDENSPGYWAPFALSIRGLAYEVMDEIELARIDYVHALRMYDVLAEELGDLVVQRLANNMKFMRVRLNALPAPTYAPVVFESISVSVPELQGAVLAAPSPCPTKVAPPEDDAEAEATPRPVAEPAAEETTEPPPAEPSTESPPEQPAAEASTEPPPKEPSEQHEEKGDLSPEIPPTEPDAGDNVGEPEKADEETHLEGDETAPGGGDPAAEGMSGDVLPAEPVKEDSGEAEAAAEIASAKLDDPTDPPDEE